MLAAVVDPTDRAAVALCSGAGRAGRAVAVALVATSLAVGGHVAAGGSAPPAAIVVAVLALAGPLCFWLSDRAWSARQLAAVFLLAQGALHFTCVFTTPGESVLATATVAMVAWHAGATAVTVAVVRYGERCLWATLDALGLRALFLPTVPAMPVRRTPWWPAWSSRDPYVHQHHVEVSPVRGPPQ